MSCPDCKGQIIETDKMGEHCSKCGLIIETYNKPHIQLFKPMKIKKGKLKRKNTKAFRNKSCLICGKMENLSVHHVIPKRTGLRTRKVILCRHPCHDIADKIANIIYAKHVTLEGEGG